MCQMALLGIKGLRESGRHSKSFVKAVAIFLFWAIKSTLITVSCNENVTRLLLCQ